MNRLATKQAGSALIETAVLMTVMLPVVFGIVMIGKLIDLKQTSEQAGRYTAWEATVYPQSGQNAIRTGAVKERFFSAADTPIMTAASDPASNRLWGDAESGDAESIADRSWEGQTDIVIDESSAGGLPDEKGVGSPSIAMRVGQTVGDTGKLLDGLSGNSWGLSTNGLLRAGVGVQVKANDWLAASDQACGNEGNFACLHSKSVILVDGWSAANDDKARRRVRSLVPASALQPLGDMVSKVGMLPMFKELKQLDGAFGHVDMSVLPEYAQ
ncbi:TadE/TadG family type IV pilus assembly protein [Granulosicoccus antarcticus]|uniref:Pilus assembly protein n=1 Tax=Granulosicoccus antarcticus IMCC3135 TaxID=1192854 RepID=A0A2Z2NY27_9GAMM|nr:TadE family protein [Granulosicoccus antarcticus]ASJ74658.1 hypothetical protein IMCC3135_22940 [Granulosicoccus antarcticus IMCC3135]